MRKLLNADPNICLIRTPAGLYRTHHHWFGQLCKLPWLVKLAPRIAKVADGFSVIISDKEFYAYRIKPGRLEPSLPTYAGRIEDAWVYKVESRSMSYTEREAAAQRNYALFCVFAPADYCATFSAWEAA